MNISRRMVMLGGSGLLAACSPTARNLVTTLPDAPQAGAQTATLDLAISTAQTSAPVAPTPRVVIDPDGLIRPQLREHALAALDIHDGRITQRDRIYIVDFARFSGEARFYELDVVNGQVKAFHTAHGRGSDPRHSGYAQAFSNVPDSHASSVGAYATGGPGMGRVHGPNVLLDGLDYSNNNARDRAIIVHAADYAEPDFLAREGKLGRSYGCFSVCQADLTYLRERMGEGRLLYAAA
ncbi:murein L,D-transpeptidase catalytic domain family protein [Brevundimonas sp. 2R-24]|uniref:Murein L,D-transpeptidase catalytic domain family protein n=1 Tax=Peiella sedimenti TaxID=3061083 RepID=A0ABT8SJX6_9CAUL|nr:murein L,D-transpeptidase catalytic domain family protein [Caulobacteraceae bacterium XZ-24]